MYILETFCFVLLSLNFYGENSIINLFYFHFPGFICSTMPGPLRKNTKQTKHKQKKTKKTTTKKPQQKNQPSSSNNNKKTHTKTNSAIFFFFWCVLLCCTHSWKVLVMVTWESQHKNIWKLKRPRWKEAIKASRKENIGFCKKLRTFSSDTLLAESIHIRQALVWF